jgi:signal transduction histidine kinase
MRKRWHSWSGRWLIALGSVWSLADVPAQTAPLILTNAAQLRSLSAAEAANQIPVRLRGVVTARNPGASVFVQDETGGTFLTHSDQDVFSLTPGEEVLIEGLSYPGLFLSGVMSAKVKRLGRAELPHPVTVTYDELLSGRFHYERVQISGIVRSVAWHERRQCMLLKVALGPRKLDVELVVPGMTNLPPLVDARVRVTGLAAGYINTRRQLRSPTILVSRPGDLRVEVSPPADPFDQPLTATGSLLRFNPDGIAGHRVRVRGTVTHQQAGEALFLRDATDGLLVRTPQTNVVVSGDVVEAVGFPAMGRFGAFLEDADFRVVGRESPPEPVVSSVAEVLQGTNDANLVTIEARLLDVLKGGEESVLVMGSPREINVQTGVSDPAEQDVISQGEGDTVFRARLPQSPPPLRHGSMLRLTGVCRVDDSNFSGPRFRAHPLEMELLLRSPVDITVLSAPSGFSTQRFVLVLGVLLGVALVASGWVVMLRRRVAKQAAVILEKVQREAVLEERHRMAREMHDTLAQSFSGLGFQLDALSTRLPQEENAARAQLDTAREMVRYGREGLRRSLMNLRAQELERGGLSDALPELARHITVGTGIELHSEVQRPTISLPEAVETNLLRIGQECLVNAVRHARPRNIHLLLSHSDGRVRLQVADDGVGFDPEQLNGNGNGNGHFGWRGIRERAAQIGAQLELETRPGCGTVVTVSVSLSA